MTLYRFLRSSRFWLPKWNATWREFLKRGCSWVEFNRDWGINCIIRTFGQFMAFLEIWRKIYFFQKLTILNRNKGLLCCAAKMWLKPRNSVEQVKSALFKYYTVNIQMRSYKKSHFLKTFWVEICQMKIIALHDERWMNMTLTKNRYH